MNHMKPLQAPVDDRKEPSGPKAGEQGNRIVFSPKDCTPIAGRWRKQAQRSDDTPGHKAPTARNSEGVVVAPAVLNATSTLSESPHTHATDRWRRRNASFTASY